MSENLTGAVENYLRQQITRYSNSLLIDFLSLFSNKEIEENLGLAYGYAKNYRSGKRNPNPTNKAQILGILRGSSEYLKKLAQRSGPLQVNVTGRITFSGDTRDRSLPGGADKFIALDSQQARDFLSRAIDSADSGYSVLWRAYGAYPDSVENETVIIK